MPQPWERKYGSPNEAPVRSTKRMFDGGEEPPADGNYSRVPLSSDDPQRARMLAQGVTLNFGDELEAFAVSNYNKLMGGETDYETIRDEIRSKITNYQRANPGEALTYELIGSIAPTAATFLLPGGQAAGVARGASVGQKFMQAGRVGREATGIGNLLRGALPTAGKGALEGGIATYGASQNPFLDSGLEIGAGAGMGAGISAVLSVLGRTAGAIPNFFYDMATSALGVKGRTVAERKVQEIVEKTGFTPDEVVSKIMRGELLAEDQSMNAIMKVLKQESGEANRRMQAILDYEKGAASSRVRDVEAVAQESLQSALAPASRMDDNLVDYLNASKADQAKVVRDAYGDVFNNPVQLSDELWSDATELMKGNRTVQKKLEDIYSTDPRASKFFKVDKNGRIQTDSRGRIILTRRPTIEDAELIKRGLDDAITEFYKGNTTAANNLADRRDAFVTKLNKFAPELEQARARASVFIDSGKAYKRGLTDLGRENQEEVMSFVNKLVDLAESGSPEQLDAYRLAILTSLKNKFGGKQDIATALSSPGSNQYTLLSKIVPEGQLDKVLEDLGVASKSRKSISKMSVGSDTQDKLLAQSLVRAPIPTQAIADALRGNFTTVLPAIIGMFNKGLSDRQLGEVTRIILADKNNVDLMKRALYDDGAFGQLQNLVNATVRTAFGGVRRQASANPRDTAVGLFGLMQ